MSVILRRLEQTLNLHILSSGVTFRAEQMKRFQPNNNMFGWID